MNKYTLRIHHSVESIQGYDPREWTEEQPVDTFEEAMHLHIAKELWELSTPFFR